MAELTPREAERTLWAIGLGTLINSLSSATINLALPVLGRDLGISLEDSRWVVQAFLLTVAVCLPITGKASDLLGYRRLYLAGFVLFGLASLLCALAPGFGSLVGARILQGVGGAMGMATAPALLLTAFPAHKRGKALGILSTATYIGLTLGPPLGGILVAHLGWRWTFGINVPLCALILWMGTVMIPRADPGRHGRIHLPSVVALFAGLPLFLFALSEGPRQGFGSLAIQSSAIVGVLSLAAFLWQQGKTEHPLIDLGLFSDRTFSGAVLSAVCNYVGLFVPILLLPFYLQEGLGRDPGHAGLILSAQPLLMALVASPSGWLSDRIGTRALAMGGMLVLALGLGALSLLDGTASTAAVVGCWAVVGLGTGIFISPNSSALMGATPKHLLGTAGSLLAQARILGMLLGVALGTILFQAWGGKTGHPWQPTEFAAMQIAVRFAAAVALLGALAAYFRKPR
jgi:EmrB/QacA subfamily drug resistance transporter